MKIILFITAILLGVILLPVGLLYSIVYRILYKTRAKSTVSDYFHSCALAIDQLRNVFCSDLFNTTLIHSSTKVPFGDADQTISAVLGYAQAENSLTSLGDLVANMLDRIDPNHCKKAMIADIESCQKLKTQN